MPKQTFYYGNRRNFIKSSSLLTSGVILGAPYFARTQNANSKINVACIGVGGKGGSDTSHAYAVGGNIVALCDVDSNKLNAKNKELKEKSTKDSRTYDAKLFKDWRKMFDELGKSIDAVTISTPDHMHGMAAISAMRMGKHIYCQKPLTQTVWEAREMRKLANEKKLATQMGNQGSAGDGLRRAVEVIQAGVIGAPTELHVWSNRPIWPQGINRPAGEDTVPENLDWDLWLGPAALRPYKSGVYHDFKWRGWYDYGTGALGDMACHTVNMPFRAMKLGYPSVVELELASRIYPETFPLSSRIRFEFPERDGLPPCKFWWYDGNPRQGMGAFANPCRPAADSVKEIVSQRGELPTSGCLVIGTKGKLFAGDDYGARFQVLMNDEKEYVAADKHEACKAVPQVIPRVTNRDTDMAMKEEWFAMMKGGPAAYSNFDISAYLTETILLGCIALRTGVGHRLDWDGPNMVAKNEPAAAQFVKRQNRKGWEI
ncbi:MAG TPA: Gfo/Idh/MocA family oxidoreductase [Candidatus Acidoferrum sp.]|nr:Gfo/Idh/MocA family oxidoreductase [Candidatus Acidoferrum sp.]